MDSINVIEELNQTREAIRELHRVEDLTNKNYNARWGLYVLGKLAVRKYNCLPNQAQKICDSYLHFSISDLETQLHELTPQPNK